MPSIGEPVSNLNTPLSMMFCITPLTSPAVMPSFGSDRDYDYRTKYGYLFAKNGGYIMCKEEVLEQIRLFLELEGLR